MSKIYYSFVFIFIFLIFLFQNTTAEYDSSTVYQETYYNDFLPSDSLKSIEELSINIDNLLKINSKNLATTKFGIGIYSVNQKKWYYQKNPDLLLTPASTTKLYTTFSLLKLLGKSFNISTEVYYSGKLESNGVLNGNLYIKGKGDALFSTKDLEILADKVKNMGVKKINGDIIADPNFYDEKTERVVYSGDKDVVQATPPITSLNIDKNTATIVVSASNNIGAAPNVFVYPYSDSHIVINNSKIVNYVAPKAKPNRKLKKKSRGEYKFEKNNNILEIDKYELAGDFPAMMLLSSAAGISISTKLDPNGNQQFIVNGNIRPNSTYTYQHLLYNPAYSIAGAFKNRLKAGGIAINGNIGILARNDTTNIKMTFLTDFKRPVFDLINIINKDSDNYLAEILFKMIGANFGANNDNAPKTRFLTDSLLKKLEIYSDGLILNDGSGLSRRNLVTVSSMVKLLENIYKSNFYDEFKNSLAIAGVDGTLKKRFHNTLAMSNLFAKTGTLRDVSALAGYVKSKDGDDIIFSFIFNGGNLGAYKLLENDIGKLISEFSIKNFNSEFIEK